MSNQDPAASNRGLSNSGTNSDPEATFDSAAAPVGVPAADLGSIGPYRLTRKLGEGGMGQVWLAEQSAPVKRQVALKIIKAGQYDGSALLRFNVERQTLAIMDHPAIAKVFDAGSTPAGQPYFVMEYVPGLPLTNYCDTEASVAPRAAGPAGESLRRRAACAPEGDHPPRPEALQYPGGRSGWQADAAHYRLRHRQGHFAAV